MLLAPCPHWSRSRREIIGTKSISMHQRKPFLNKVLKFLTAEFEGWPESNKVKWSFDIDPIDLS